MRWDRRANPSTLGGGAADTGEDRIGHGIRSPYAEPDWLPDVIARYSLTPPPAPR